MHNVAGACSVLGLAQDDFSLIGRGCATGFTSLGAPPALPALDELLEQAETLGAVGAMISGAGPAVLFWCHWQQTGNPMEALKGAADCDVRRVQFALGGADVREL